MIGWGFEFLILKLILAFQLMTSKAVVLNLLDFQSRWIAFSSLLSLDDPSIHPSILHAVKNKAQVYYWLCFITISCWVLETGLKPVLLSINFQTLQANYVLILFLDWQPCSKVPVILFKIFECDSKIISFFGGFRVESWINKYTVLCVYFFYFFFF